VARSSCDSIFGSLEQVSRLRFHAYQILRCISKEGRRCWCKDDLLLKQNNVKLDSCIKSLISVSRVKALKVMMREERIESRRSRRKSRNRKLCCTNKVTFIKNRKSSVSRIHAWRVVAAISVFKFDKRAILKSIQKCHLHVNDTLEIKK